MREFFQGWRRKTGLALLALAMLFMMAWMRTAVVMDQINFTVNGDMHQVWAERGLVVWMREPGCGSERHFSWHFQKPNPDQSFDPFDNDQGRIRCRTIWNVLEIRLADLVIVERRSTMGIWADDAPVISEIHCPIWVVPYWVLVLPLTVLSAILLLSNPRLPKSKETAK